MKKKIKLNLSENIAVAKTLTSAVEAGKQLATDDLPSLFGPNEKRLREWASYRLNVVRFCRKSNIDIGKILRLRVSPNGHSGSSEDRIARIEAKLDAIMLSLGVSL